MHPYHRFVNKDVIVSRSELSKIGFCAGHLSMLGSSEELCGEYGRIQPCLFLHANQGQAQRQHHAGRARPHHPHRLWLHAEQLPWGGQL